VATPHDELFRFTFQHARHAAPWFRSVLPPTLANAIDWQSLAPAPAVLQGETLRLQIADLVFHAERTGGRGPVWLLAEHKSHRDPGVASQLLRYAVHLRERPPRDGVVTPVPVLAVLLHHGDEPFVPATTGDDPFAATNPHHPFFVDDLTVQTEEGLRARGLTPLATLTFLCLAKLRGLAATDTLAAFDRWADLLRATDRGRGPPRGHDALRVIGYHALRVAEAPALVLHETFERILQRPEETIMSTAEKLKDEGMQKGRVEVLLRQLAKRFGPVPEDLVERVRRGSTEDLERWTDRILDAATRDGVFA
jgi:hypothetical protein